ncbi:hypothetical protein L484_005417 [Morus notabilis]|uniref:Uncharacterized protein n=1 Tax=Morus notabilis TaxID=981085 RepID=W9R920_9ROSA|nr:hypothetical protein L484_005417 [Morus notabilis]
MVDLEETTLVGEIHDFGRSSCRGTDSCTLIDERKEEHFHEVGVERSRRPGTQHRGKVSISD